MSHLETQSRVQTQIPSLMIRLNCPPGKDFNPHITRAASPDWVNSSEIQKKDLVSGEYSLHILGNNGNGEPFAYQRDFSLLVGPQQTTTYTPTVTVQSTLIPILNSTSTNTYVSTTTLAPATVTQPSTTLHPSTTITPAKVTSTTTSTLGTITLVDFTVPISQVVVTSTATCITPTKQKSPDPTCTTGPCLAAAAPLETPASAKFRRLAIDRAQRIQERKERLGEMQKRSPDSATITVTDLNTDDYFTTTTTVTGPATTLTVVSTSTVFATETPPPMTVFSGVSTASTITITAPTPTKTRTVYTNAVALITSTRVKTVTVTTIVTPSASLAACAQIGGIIN
ncbi:hypothetical protein MMC29_004721 [Sticta canariensis]|nr:hypothetical protein [Sticta canariensis]